jgi:uncharacterized membrane protein HdeD (DUF308 family)
MTTAAPPPPKSPTSAPLGSPLATGLDSLSPGWSLALGILLILAGVLALVHPVMAALAAAIYVGWFAIIAGVIAIVVAIRTRSEPNFGWRIAVGILYLLLGFLLVSNPVAGAATLALFVGALMACSGVVEIMLAMRRRPRAGWGWLLANGILSLLLAVMIVIGWPMESLVLIGYLVGFQIIFCGIARVALAMSAKKTAS